MAAGRPPLLRRAAARLPAGVRVLGRTPNGLLVGLYGACSQACRSNAAIYKHVECQLAC
jgi:hypothetical protein